MGSLNRKRVKITLSMRARPDRATTMVVNAGRILSLPVRFRGRRDLADAVSRDAGRGASGLLDRHFDKAVRVHERALHAR